VPNSFTPSSRLDGDRHVDQLHRHQSDHGAVWTAVLNGFLAPPLMVVIMLVSNNRKVMGKRTNTPLINVLGWAATIIMFAGAIALVLTSIHH